MKLRFGLHLDGQHGRPPSNLLGVADVGPLGLLGILEVELGLAVPVATPAQRIVQYRDCLYQCLNAQRFYAKSFEADDFGTAARLLAWRDEWRLHGWSGEIGEAASARLRDMAAVERVAQRVLAPGLPELLDAVLSAMAKRTLKIRAVTLLEPLDTYPVLWQHILAKLPLQSGVAPSAKGRGMLGELQQALVDAQGAGELKAIDWRDDRSVQVVRAETSLTAGRWIAETLRQAAPDVLLVTTSEASTLDTLLGAADHPRQGLSAYSAFRPALQVLPLMLELLWAPLNFQALIQFLSHPIGPLPAKVRRQLASVQSDHPGIGGPRWREAVDTVVQEYGDRGDSIRDAIGYWIEHPRYALATGVPTDLVLERSERLIEFFNRCPNDAPIARRQAYGAGFQQCQAFAQNLGQLLKQGVATLQRRQIEQLVGQVSATGTDNPLRVAQVGAVPDVCHPGAVVESHHTVLWGPLDAPALVAPWAWSMSEIADLRSAGCQLPDTAAQLQQMAQEWIRPILAATDRLILVLPPADRESHPVWQLVHAVLKGMPVHSIESLTLDGAATHQAIPHRPLPSLKRWWQLPAGAVVPAPATWSFTQLERQVFNPYHWLLSYAAKLRTGSLLSLADDFRLKGLLAHSLVERMFSEAHALTMTKAQFDDWFNPAFDALIAQEGAVYLMPGSNAQREDLRYALRRALTVLRDVLADAGVTTVEPERALNGHFVGGALQGYSDLVLTNAAHTCALMDMKWTGKRHREKLQENRHLQLALYAELLRQSNGQWPALAYFMIREAKLLTRHEFWFPNVHPVSSQTQENTAQLWQQFQSTWKWRQAQFQDGLFEVVLSEDDDPLSIPPPDALPIEVLNTQYNECLHLAGWADNA